MRKRLFTLFACIMLALSFTVPSTVLAANTSKVPAALKKTKLSSASVSVEATKTLKLNVKNLPKGYSVKWSTSDDSVAKVSKGKVTGLNPGEAVISAKIVKGKKAQKTVSCNVKVTPLVVPTFSDAVLTMDGDIIVDTDTGLNFSFKLDKTCTAKIEVLDSSDEAVYTKSVDVQKNRSNSLNWKGDVNKGAVLTEDLYKIRVTADTAVLESDTFMVYEDCYFSGGTGSVANPYKVSTIAELKKMPMHNRCNFVLTNDLDMEYSALEGLFSSEIPFNGTFDGKGYSILNVVNSKCMIEAVGEEGVIRNLTVNGMVLNPSGGSAMFVGTNRGKIEDCSLLDVSAGASKINIGGLVGTNSGTIKGCTVTGTFSTAEADEAGIALVNDTTGKIISCSVNLNITYGCGFLGCKISHNGAAMICFDNNGFIANCVADGTTEGRVYDSRFCAVGNLVSYNYGTVSGCSFVGASDWKDVCGGSGVVQ